MRCYLLLLFASVLSINAATFNLTCNGITSLGPNDNIYYEYQNMTPSAACIYTIMFPGDSLAYIEYSARGLKRGEFIRMYNDNGVSLLGNDTQYTQSSNYWPPSKVYIQTHTNMISATLKVQLYSAHVTNVTQLNFTTAVGKPKISFSGEMKTGTAYTFTSKTRVAVSGLLSTVPYLSSQCVFDGPSTQSKFMGTLSNFLNAPFISTGNSLTLYSFDTSWAVIINDYANMADFNNTKYVYIPDENCSYIADATQGPVAMTLISDSTSIIMKDISFSMASSTLKVYAFPLGDMMPYYMFQYSASNVSNAMWQNIPLRAATLVLDSGTARVSFLGTYSVNYIDTSKRNLTSSSSGYLFSTSYFNYEYQGYSTNLINADYLDPANTSITVTIQPDQFLSTGVFITIGCSPNMSNSNTYIQPLGTKYSCQSNYMNITWNGGGTTRQLIQYQMDTAFTVADSGTSTVAAVTDVDVTSVPTTKIPIVPVPTTKCPTCAGAQ